MADGTPQAAAVREKTLREYGLLATNAKPDSDDIVGLAALLCKMPMAAFSIVDEQQERFISCHGCLLTTIGSSKSGFANRVVSTGNPLIVANTSDSPFHDAPLAAALPDLKFYAGVPLVSPGGVAFGTLAVMDRTTRDFSNEALSTLAILAEHIVKQLESKRERGGKNAAHAEQSEADARTWAHDLKRQNDHLRFAQRVANIGSWEYNVADSSRTWSDEVYRILGIDRESMPETIDTISAVVHPDDKPLMEDARNRALSGEENPEFVHRIIRPDGEIRHVRERAELISDADGNPVRLFGTIQDITDQKLTRDRLQQSEHLLRIAGKMAKLGAWQLDVSEQRVTWSEEVCEIHELAPCPSIALKDAINYIAPEWRDKVKGFIDECIREGTPYDEEFEIITTRGRRVWARAIGQAIRNEAGNVACIQGALQDITQEKKAEAAVKRLAARLASTLENITDAFVTLDNDWTVTYMNKQAESLMGITRDDLLGKNIWNFYKEEVGGAFYQHYHRAKDENRTVAFEEYSPQVDLWLDVTAYPSQDGLAVYFRDITARKKAEAATRESEERTRLIIETAMDAVISIDSDSVITGWNPQAETTFGWSGEEALGRYLYEMIIPEQYRDAHRRGIDHFLATGEGPLLKRRAEVTALHKDGHEFSVELSISPIRTGNTFSFSAFVRDITARKEIESAIRESEERFRIVSKATADTVWDWNFTTDTIWWNDGIQTVFGYDVDEVSPDSRFWFENIHPEDRPRVVAEIQHVKDGEADEWTGEYRFRRKNGSFAHVIDRGFAIRDYTGRTIRMVGGINDITERKEYETQVTQQAALLDKAQDAIIVRDMDDRIMYWNKSAERLYGWTMEEVIGRSAETLLYHDRSVFRKIMSKLHENGEWAGEITQRRKDNSKASVEGAWTLVRDDEGNPVSVLAINTDITERLALEEQLRQSQRLEAIGQLTGGVAHDFNNLLTVILGNAELMADSLPRGERLYKLAEMTRTAAMRGADLTHRLLAFARRQALEPKGVDVDRMVIGMESLLRRTLLDNVDLEIIQNEDLWRAYVDPSQLESVLLNLCINAKDAMPDGGHLTIETSNTRLDKDYAAQNSDVEAGRYVMIAVSDTGMGITPENIGRVFDPFFTTKETGKGTGLGLSMAYGFSKQSHGHIKLYSEPGQGTTVKLYLPVAEQRSELAEPALVDERDFSGTETILVVEDDDLVRRHAESQLAEFGYDVIVAGSGPEAMEIIRNGKEDIDLLFTDVIMSGGMNGRELAEMAKRLRPKLKVLYTSGYTENAIVHHGRLDRGVNLLQKPYQRADLAKKVKVALREPSGGEQAGNAS